MVNKTKTENKKLIIDGYKIKDKFELINEDLKIEMLRTMYRIRHFEYMTEQLLIRGMINGTCHLYIGEEATAVGAIFSLEDDDYITSTHRGHGHCIAGGASLNLMMAELMGKKTGYCKGKGGSLHIANIDAGNLGANGIVGGSIGIATGAALTSKMDGNTGVVLCFIGEGATNRGIFHESINMASIWNLPIIYIVENNIYGLSTPVKEAFNISKISDRKYAYGIEGLTIDGNNIIEVYNTISHFIEVCRKGNGPIIVESRTYRWKGHSKSDAQVYRSKEEVKSWMEKDPIKRYKRVLKKDNFITDEIDSNLEKEIIEEVKIAVDYAKESPLPDPSEVEEDVYA